MSRAGGIRAGGAFVELSTSDKLSAGLKKAQDQLNQFASALRSVGMVAAGAGAALASALAAATKSFADQGDALDEMSTRTGVSVEALSELQYGAKLAGVESETLETSLRFMVRALNDASQGGKGAIEMLAQLGLRSEDLQGLSPDKQLELIADRLGGVVDPGQRAALAMELFGRSGTAMLPMLSGGAAGIQQMRDRARELGLTFTAEGANSAARFSDALDELTAVLQRAWQAVGEQLAPTLTQLVQIATNGAVALLKWVQANKGVVLGAAAAAVGLMAVGGLVIGLSVGMNLLAGACAIVTAAMSVLTAVTAALGVAQALLVGGIALVVVAIAGVAVAAGAMLLYFNGTLGKMFDTASSTLGEIAGTFKTMFGGIMDALQAGDMDLASKILWAGLEVVWEQGIIGLQDLWNKFLAGMIRTMLDTGKTVAQVFAVLTGNMALSFGIEQLANSNEVKGLVAMGGAIATAIENRGASPEALKRLQAAKEKLDDARVIAEMIAENQRLLDDENKRALSAPTPLDPVDVAAPQLPKLEIDTRAIDRLMTIGTFSGDFASQLGAEIDTNGRRTADSTAQMVILGTKIERHLQQAASNGGLVFT
jgi:hypothetical protein